MMKPWRLYLASERGRRSTNDDYLAAAPLKKGKRRYYVLVACDGVGSRPGSKECARAVGDAALAAVDEFLQHRRSRRALREDDVEDLKNTIRQTFGGLGGPTSQATTFCCAVFSSESIVCIWAGDSRAYLLNKQAEVIQLTRDHHNDEGVITSYVDGSGYLRGSLGAHLLALDTPPAAVCLTTDGVHEACSSEEFCRFLIYLFTSLSNDRDQLNRELSMFLEANLGDNASLAIWLPRVRQGLKRQFIKTMAK